MWQSVRVPGNDPNTSAHLEVERKFDVDASTVSPSFDGIAAVARVERPPAQSLQADYFDTPAHGLAARRITLRCRTGDSDAGWQLKLPAGQDARTEVRASLESTGVPAELSDVVAAIVRDRPLKPVARINTTRNLHLLYGTDGGRLAEFCDDHVTASAADADGEPQCWREWELELVDAGTELLDLLGNRLNDAGARRAGHGSKLARVVTAPDDGARHAETDSIHRAVAEQVEQLLAWDRAVRADADDAVHQMRVTTRKIRSLLQASAEAFGLTEDTSILDELRELAAILGEARDAEVLAQRYRASVAELAPELVRGRARERLVDDAVRGYHAGLRRSLAAMRSARYFRLLDGLDALVAAPPAARADAPTTIDAAYRRVRKAAKAAADDGGDEALHRIRKRAKRLRYTATATGATKVAKRAKTVQTLLGDHQDSVVSREHLLHQADSALAAGEDTFTYGLLYQQEDSLADDCHAQLDDALEKLDKAVRQVR